MTKVKFHGWDLKKTDSDEVEVRFKVKYLSGVDIIVTAFSSVKTLLEGAVLDGALSMINIFGTLYQKVIKAGKNA